MTPCPGAPLGAARAPGGVIHGLRFIAPSGPRPLLQGVTGGVIDARGAFIDLSAHRRRGRTLIGAPRDVGEAAETRRGRAIYAGPLQGAFGHILLEGIARLWGAERHPDAALVWAAPAAPVTGFPTAFPPVLAALVRRLGLGNPLLAVSRPTRFDEVIAPAPGYVIDDLFHPEHVRFLERRGAPHRPVAGRRVWLSRALLNARKRAKGRHAAAEDRIARFEADLAAAGWIVAHPQALDLDAQLDLVASAERVAGLEGSALHSIVALSGAERLIVDIFARNQTLTGNFETVARGKRVDQRVHEGDRRTDWDAEMRRMAAALDL